MDFNKKLIDFNKEALSLIKKIEDHRRWSFQQTGSANEVDWSDEDRARLIHLEKKLQDSQQSIQKFKDEIDRKNLKLDRKSGKFVRI